MAEIQDLYDIHRNPTGEIFVRGGIVPEGRYRLGVQVWLRNDEGQLLLTQRHPAKKKPLLWEPTGGAVNAGEDTLTAGVRELREEIGVYLKKEQLTLVHTAIYNGNEFLDTYLAAWNGSFDELTLQPDEVVDARWVGRDELIDMARRGLLADDFSSLPDFPDQQETKGDF